MRGTCKFGGGPDPIWVPDAAHQERSRLLAAMRSWAIESVEELHRQSIDDPEWFWRAVVDDLDIAFTTPFEQVRDDTDGVQFPRWFTGGTLNAANLCALRHATGPVADKTAVVYEGDLGQRQTLSYRELGRHVRWFAAHLAAQGIGHGDRVVIYMPVIPQATVAFLACAMIGAVSVPAFTGFSATALGARITDSGANAVITADGTTRRGAPVQLKPVVDEAIDEASAEQVQLVVTVRHNDEPVSMVEGRDVFWDELGADVDPVDVVPVEPNHPLTIVYTSGTTGRPKGIVHSHAGLIVKAGLDFAYGFDVHADDTIAWISDMGWLVGPLLIYGGLQLGATVVFTEGVPTFPTANRMWEIIERNQVTMQGIAPTAARAMMAVGAAPDQGLTSLRAFASTGEAWDGPTWQWLFSDIGDEARPIMNYSGGTEIGGGILVGYPFLPMAKAAFNGPLPGMDVAVVGDDGAPIVGEVGELAVLNTWPGMTHAFWDDRERYLETYWGRWEGVWQHGDLASVDADGVWQIHGRSDDTIKVSGRRIGPAEIEAALLRDRRVVEAAAIGVPDPQRGQRIVAFVTVGDDTDPADLQETAVQNVGRSFAPELYVVSSLPKTKNGKIMRRAIRSQHLGSPVGDMSSLDPTTPLEDIPTRASEGGSS